MVTHKYKKYAYNGTLSSYEQWLQVKLKQYVWELVFLEVGEQAIIESTLIKTNYWSILAGIIDIMNENYFLCNIVFHL